jgi:hypothetical protein
MNDDKIIESKLIDKEINIKATLIGVRERQERLYKIREKKKSEENYNNITIGVPLLYNIMKNQNIKLLDDMNLAFKDKLSFNTDLKKEFIKPPYLTPKITKHKLTKVLNQT